MLHLFLIFLSCPCFPQLMSQSSALSIETLPSIKTLLQHHLLSKVGPDLSTNNSSLRSFPGISLLLLTQIITNLFYSPTQPDHKRLEAGTMFYKHFIVIISASSHLSPLCNSTRTPWLLTDVLLTLVINPEAQESLFCNFNGHSQKGRF